MRKLLAIAATLAACAGLALAQADQAARDCGQDPETTGSLAADPRSLLMPGERLVRAAPDPPEVSWQDEAQESFEQRRRDLLDCAVNSGARCRRPLEELGGGWGGELVEDGGRQIQNGFRFARHALGSRLEEAWRLLN